MSTAQLADPGSSGEIWAASRTSSRRISTRRPFSRERRSPARSSRLSGTNCAATPSAVMKLASTTPASAGSCRLPRRSAYSWPSGNRALTPCAARTAKAVLPIPPMPVITTTGGASPWSAVSACASRPSEGERPVKSTVPAGNCAGTGGAPTKIPLVAPEGVAVAAGAGGTWGAFCAVRGRLAGPNATARSAAPGAPAALPSAVSS